PIPAKPAEQRGQTPTSTGRLTPSQSARPKRATQPVTPIAPQVKPMARPVVPPPAPPHEWKGNNDTSIQHSGQVVILNETQWNHFWAEHHPEEVSPDIDFSRNMVVGVFLGQRPADAFAVDITGIRTTADSVFVDYIERVPPPGTFQVAVEVYPYDVKVI